MKKRVRSEIIKEEKGNIKSCDRCFNLNFTNTLRKDKRNNISDMHFVICKRTSNKSGILDREIKFQKNAVKKIRKM